MDFYLLVIGIGFIFVGYILIGINYFKYSNINNKNNNGFDMAKDITDKYDSINVILADNLFSRYIFKRRVIRLNKKNYYGSDDYSLAISSFLAGVSLINDKDLKGFNKIIPSIDFYNKSSLVMGIISLMFYSIGDSKIGIVFGSIILVYQYFYLNIISFSINNIKERVDDKVIYILNNMYKYIFC